MRGVDIHMTDMTSSTEDTGPLDDSPTGLHRFRGYTFVAVVLAGLVLAAVMLGEFLTFAFLAWGGQFGVHQIHDLILTWSLWLGIVVAFAVLLYRPKDRVNAMLAPFVFLVPIIVFAVIGGSEILMLPLIFGGIAIVLAALHPAGRDLLRFERAEKPNRLLLGLYVVAAIALLVYAGDQAIKQLTLTDEHAIPVHYGGMVASSLFVVVMGGLAILRDRDWRFAAWSAGIVALVLGVASVMWNEPSSLGVIGGSLTIVFAIALVAGVEYTRREPTETERPAIGTPT